MKWEIADCFLRIGRQLVTFSLFRVSLIVKSLVLKPPQR